MNSRRRLLFAISIGVVIFAASLVVGAAKNLPISEDVLVGGFLGSVTAAASWYALRKFRPKVAANQERRDSMFREIRGLLRQISGFVSELRMWSDYDTAERIQQICDDAETYLQKIVEKDPDTSLTQTVTLLGKLMALNSHILPQYKEYLGSPRWNPNHVEEIALAREGINTFHQEILGDIAALEQPDSFQFLVAVTLIGLSSKSMAGKLQQLGILNDDSIPVKEEE